MTSKVLSYCVILRQHKLAQVAEAKMDNVVDPRTKLAKKASGENQAPAAAAAAALMTDSRGRPQLSLQAVSKATWPTRRLCCKEQKTSARHSSIFAWPEDKLPAGREGGIIHTRLAASLSELSSCLAGLQHVARLGQIINHPRSSLHGAQPPRPGQAP